MFFTDPTLKSIVDRVNKRVITSTHPMVENEVLDILEENIALAYPLLDVFLMEDKDFENYPSTEHQSCLLIFCEILAYLHYSIEQERSWAIKFSAELQNYIAEHAFKADVNPEKIRHLFEIFHQTEIEISDAIRNANAELLETIEGSNPDEIIDMASLLEEIVEFGNHCEFELYENIISQTYQVVPIEVQIVLAIEMAESNNKTIHNCAVLMLLHPEPGVRQQIGLTLAKQTESLSPESLRRLIIMRNWVVRAERPAIDRLIKANRLRGVACASIPRTKIIKILSTGFDGIGSQSILALVKNEQDYSLAGLLLKENMGIREPLIFKSHKKKELDAVIKGMIADSPCLHISMEYLDQAIPHHLNMNLKHGRPPSPLLLNFAEILGAEPWPAESINTACQINALYDQIKKSNKYIELENKSLTESHHWLKIGTFADTWFEQDADVDNALGNLFKDCILANSLQIDQLVIKVCEKVLEPRRQKWRDRLLWTALWAKSNTKKPGPKWEELLILAKFIQDDTPLLSIPLMQAISEETIYVAAKELMNEI